MQTLFTKTQDLAYAPPWSDYRPRVFVSPHMPAARGAMSTSQNSILKAIVAHDYEFALLIDCQTGRFTSCHSSQDYEIFPKEGNYHEELIAASEQRIYPSDRRHFLHSLTIDAMREALERSQQRVLFRRFSANGQIVWVEANFFYISEARDEIVLTCYPNNPQAADLPAGSSPQILPYQQGMQMGDNDMFTNFLVADLENDRCVRPPHTDGNMQDTVSFRKQIEWFANNLLVPEQREEYLRFFEPENLVPLLRRNRGFYCAHFTLQIDDDRHDVANVISLLPAPCGSPCGSDREFLFAYVLDITHLQEIREHSRQLMQQSRLDPLTGIANRQAAENDIAHYLHVQPEGESSLLLILDIDYFKHFNDNYGHETGDKVLSFIARTLKATFRKEDVVGRWGGDEFLLFLKNFRSMEAVTERLHKLRTTLESFEMDGMSLPIQLSIGGAVAEGTCNSVLELFRLADTALYMVKREGRNGFVYFTDTYVRAF
ncbi:hypothetical protein B5F76_08760 [Desulfovibrio sp. An276]|nr:hypothetical protein B5F76_08760 [Desulfovibrio sp. An276]